MRIILLVLITICLGACSTIEKIKGITNSPPPEPEYDLKAAWIAQPTIDLEKHPAFGVPSQKATLSDGSVAYVYQFYGNMAVRSHAFGNEYGAHGYSEIEQAKCAFTFYSKDNVITDLNMVGHCRRDRSRLPSI